MSRLSIYASLLAFACSSVPAWAVAPVLASDLARECASGYSAEDVPERCAIYIAGFLDGAVSTDTRVAENVADEIDRDETLTQRAIRTRVGERMRRFGPSVYAEYCIGDPVPIQEVIALIRSDFDAKPPSSSDLARDSVYSVLRKNYPCRE